jgi:UDP-N-acetylglucosamine enolpyruvyl transferase
VAASDIRAGAALVVAALAAEGETKHRRRPPRRPRATGILVGKLRTLGADIVRVD